MEVNAFDVTAGGIRIHVDGYDSAGALITPAPNQVTFAGAPARQFGEQDVGINTSVISKFFVTDSTCQFVVIRVRVGGTNIAFSGLSICAQVADIIARRKMEIATHTVNNFV